MLKLDCVLNDGQIAEVRKIIEAAKFVDGSVSGKATLKRNLQVACSTPQFDAAVRVVASALMARDEFKAYALPKQITLEFNRYDPGMFYKAHMDTALMGGLRGQPMRADLSFSVYLSDPADYRGGDFVLQTPYGQERIKQDVGSAIV